MPDIFQKVNMERRIFRKYKSRQTRFILRAAINKLICSLFLLLVFEWLRFGHFIKRKIQKTEDKMP